MLWARRVPGPCTLLTTRKSISSHCRKAVGFPFAALLGRPQSEQTVLHPTGGTGLWDWFTEMIQPFPCYKERLWERSGEQLSGATSSPDLCEWWWGFQIHALQRAACTIPCHPAWQVPGALIHIALKNPWSPPWHRVPCRSGRAHSPRDTGWSPAQHPGKTEPSTPVK